MIPFVYGYTRNNASDVWLKEYCRISTKDGVTDASHISHALFSIEFPTY